MIVPKDEVANAEETKEKAAKKKEAKDDWRHAVDNKNAWKGGKK